MNRMKCKFVDHGKCTNPCAEAIECPTETYDSESSYECCDWYTPVELNDIVEEIKKFVSESSKQLIPAAEFTNKDFTYTLDIT